MFSVLYRWHVTDAGKETAELYRLEEWFYQTRYPGLALTHAKRALSGRGWVWEGWRVDGRALPGGDGVPAR